MQALGLAVMTLILAVIVEGFVEYFVGLPFQKIPTLNKYSWLLAYVSLVLGEIVAFYFSIDILFLISEYALGSEWLITPGGIFITGVCIGRGSNYVHQILSKWFPITLH